MLAPLYTPLTGGAETYLRLLAEGLAAADHKTAVVTDGSWLPGEPAWEMRAGVEVIRLRDFASELDRRDKVRWRRMQYAILDELAGCPGSPTWSTPTATRRCCSGPWSRSSTTSP